MEKNKLYRYKDDVIRAILVDDEDVLSVDCKSKTIRNRSSYLRKMALNGMCINLNSEDLHKASSLLCRTSNNMNQYAKKVNATGSIYLEDIKSMREKYNELITLFGKVLHQYNEIAEALE